MDAGRSSSIRQRNSIPYTSPVNAALVYSADYDISLPGLDWLHPFDGRKFSRAWSRVCALTAGACEQILLRPEAPIAASDLLRIHSRGYLESLRSSSVVAKALEVRPLSWLPSTVVERRILKPMRFACAGTLLAMRHALKNDAITMNLGGGFHHAFRDHGEGFCIYADVAAAHAAVRAEGLLSANDPVAIIDLDAHRGNGVWNLCGSDPSVRVLDVYNAQVYPGLFPGSIEELPFILNDDIKNCSMNYHNFSYVPSQQLLLYHSFTAAQKQ